MDIGVVVQAVIFALLGTLTAIASTTVSFVYDDLFVPTMSPGQLYPPYVGPGAPSSVFSHGADMSQFLLVNLVDPIATLVIFGIGVLYLLRSALPAMGRAWTDLGPRLLFGILLANCVLPLTSALWDLSAAVYPLVSNYDHGAWSHYTNLVGPGAISFAWDNGLVTFLVTLTLFTLIFLLVLIVAVR